MFPFSYNTRITVPIEKQVNIDTKEILIKFKDQFDNPRLTDQNTLAFDNFNFSLKRHKWLSNGVLTIAKNDTHVHADLNLGFYMTAVTLLLLSVALVVIQFDRLWFALLGVAVTWFVFALLYLWTTTMFVMTIKRTIGYDIFSKASGLDSEDRVVVVKDRCPGCGSALKGNETECAECGLNFAA